MIRKLPDQIGDPLVDRKVKGVFNHREFEQGILYNCSGAEHVMGNLTIDFIGAYWGEVGYLLIE